MTRTDFNKLIHTCSRKLYGYAYRILKDREGSEDAVQEIFVKLWKMNTRLQEYENVEALATTMIKNYCIDQLRKLKHIKQGDEFAFEIYDFNYAEPSPQERIESQEIFEIVHKIIANLPDIYRKVIQLRDIDELSYEEIADITGQNINTLRVNLSRARKLIRDELKRYYDESRRN